MMGMVDTNAATEESLTGVNPRPLLDAGKARAMLLTLAAGQSVAPCQMPFLVLYYFIEGQGQMSVEGQQTEFHPGSLAAVPAGAVRLISADLPTRVLAVQVP